MCVFYINIKGGQVYPVPPWCCLVRRCVLPGACMHPLGWTLCRRRHLSIYDFLPLGPVSLVGWGVGWWGCVNLMC